MGEPLRPRPKPRRYRPLLRAPSILTTSLGPDGRFAGSRVEVKLYEHEQELCGLVRSGGWQAKENAMRRQRLVRLRYEMRAMRRSLPERDEMVLRIGAAPKEAGRAFGFVELDLPSAGQGVTGERFRFGVNRAKAREAEQRDGDDLLRTNLTGEDPAVLWARYVQLTQIEAVFRSSKSELRVRPVYHRLEHRVDAHILVAFGGYCVQVTLQDRLPMDTPGLTPMAVMEKLARIQMIDVWIPTTDGRHRILPRYTQPEKDLAAWQAKTGLTLPAQPAPRITALAAVGQSAGSRAIGGEDRVESSGHCKGLRLALRGSVRKPGWRPASRERFRSTSREMMQRPANTRASFRLPARRQDSLTTCRMGWASAITSRPRRDILDGWVATVPRRTFRTGRCSCGSKLGIALGFKWHETA